VTTTNGTLGYPKPGMSYHADDLQCTGISSAWLREELHCFAGQPVDYLGSVMVPLVASRDTLNLKRAVCPLRLRMILTPTCFELDTIFFPQKHVV